jgi:hypothetical protein
MVSFNNFARGSRMTIDASATHFSRLSAIGLISEEQRNAALTHPKRTAIGAASPARCLAWMVEQRIISFAELDDWPIDNPEEVDERYWDEQNEVLDEALPEIGRVGPGMNAGLLDELARDGFITESQRDSAAGAPFFLILDTPAQALAHVVATNAMSQADFDALLAGARCGQGAEHAEWRVRIVKDAAADVERLRKLYKPLTHPVRRAGLHGGWRFLISCAVLVCGYSVYQFVTSVPLCGSAEIKESVQLRLYSEGMKVDKNGFPRVPKLGQIKEVGHARARRQRGCTATVEFNGESLPYTYVILGLAAGRKTKVSFLAANRTIVEARFGNIGYDGNFGNKAEPIGRDNLEAALIAGVDRLRGRLIPSPKKILPEVMDIFTLANLDRRREIVDVEPIGACRALQFGTRYACRVIVERNDPLSASLRQEPDILDAEFIFERQEAGAEWRMADDFSETFAQAIAKARMAALTGKENG